MCVIRYVTCLFFDAGHTYLCFVLPGIHSHCRSSLNPLEIGSRGVITSSREVE